MQTRPLLLAPLLLVLIAAAPAPSASQLLSAQRAELARQAAAQAKASATGIEEQRLTAARIAEAARLQATDDSVAAAAARVSDLAVRRASAQAQLDQHARAVGPMLPLIERLALYPAETLLAVPMSPERAVRGLLVLGGITRQLQADAAALRAEQRENATLQRQLDANQATLRTVAADQARQAAALDAQIAAAQAARGTAQDEATMAARRAAAYAARAGTLRAAIAAIEADRRAAERSQAHAAQLAATKHAAAQVAVAMAPVVAKGGWTAPVSGRVDKAFGTVTDAGPSSGVSFATPPGARVVSPCNGRVVFSGLFRSFGLLAIVDCGAATHVVLAGLERLDGRVGQAVQAGEPLGVMAQWNPASRAAARPSLYVELRRGGQAVDPAPYLHSS